MTRRLVLFRHGQTAWNDTGRAQGHADVPLDDLGRAQAVAAASGIAALHPVALWSSDLARARETAEIVAAACGLPLKTDARFREYDVGERQGLTVAETSERWPELGTGWELGNPPAGVPGSESYDDVAARIVPACREALDSLDRDETGVVVGHGACLKVAIAGLLGWPAGQTTTLRGLGNCEDAVVEERLADGRMLLAGYALPPISRT